MRGIHSTGCGSRKSLPNAGSPVEERKRNNLHRVSNTVCVASGRNATGNTRFAVDYIHWNPRKHGLVFRVRDWGWSSFHRFISEGQYDIDWGGNDPTPGWDSPEWGE